LIGLAFWNIVLTLLTGLNRRLPFHREIGLSVDIVLAAAYFVLAGGIPIPVSGLCFLPLMTAALYFEIIGALVSAVLMTAAQVVVTVSQTLSPVPLIFLGLLSLVTFIIAGVFGYISVQLVKTIRRNRQTSRNPAKKLGMENERLRAIYSLTSTLLATLITSECLNLSLTSA